MSGVDHNSDNLIFLVYRSILVTIWIMDFMCTKGKDTKISFSFRYFSLSHQDKKQVVKGNDRAAPQKWEGWSQVWDREGRHSWTKISFLGSSRPSCNVLPTGPTREECVFAFGKNKPWRRRSLLPGFVLHILQLLQPEGNLGLSSSDFWVSWTRFLCKTWKKRAIILTNRVWRGRGW